MRECEDISYLPDTQPATQPVEEDLRYDAVLSQEETHYWARLYPARDALLCHDLVENEICVGRLTACEVTISEEQLPPLIWALISKRHFIISRGSDLGGSRTSNVVIKDLSMNGTFVNGKILGKNRSCPLKNNDVISVAKPHFKVFYFSENYPTSQIPYEVQNTYHISIQLGSGAFGEVSLVFHKETGKGYAMKTLIKENMANEKKLLSEIQKLENEFHILKSLRHPNVIQLIDFVDCPKQKFLILEFMQGKDLYDRITISTKLTEDQSKLYFYQIASGVEYLHRNGIVHRDLKPENILLANEEVDTIVKISDFGLSKIVHSGTYLHSLCGTRMYVAPEILISGGMEKYTGKVDVWSMGVILFVCLSGQTPFRDGQNNMTIDEQIKSAKYNMNAVVWHSISTFAKKLVKRMMTLKPEKRIDIEDALADPWFADNSMKAKLSKLLTKCKSMEQDKENTFRSPVPANVGLQGCSVTPSPPRKRIKMDIDDDTTTLLFMK